MSRTIRVAVVGLSWPGMRHLESYLKHPDVEVIAVCDANRTLLASVQQEFAIKRGFEDLEALLALDDLDAVSICTPNYLHEPMTRAALAAGKHVLCEKPLASTLEQGERMAAAARESDRVCMVGFSRRYRQESRAVKTIIERGDLGEIYHARTGWLRRRWNPHVRGWFLSKELAGGGPLIDLGVHMLDLTLWLMGHPKVISVSGSVSHHFTSQLAQGSTADVEDLASAYLRLANGATVILETSWRSYSGGSDQIFCQLVGTNGGLKIDLGGAPSTSPPIEMYFDRGETPFTAAPLIPVDTTAGYFLTEISEFVSAIQESRPPASTVEQGLEILRILDAIYRSAELGAEVRL